MEKKPNDAATFRAQLDAHSSAIPDELRLPSLRQRKLEGFASLFVAVVPMLSSRGEPVITNDQLRELFAVLDDRFGGCMVPSLNTHPPYWGLWNPSGKQADPEKDYVTTVQVFANPIESSNRFFKGLKEILKKAGNTEQEDILISRLDCCLI